MEIYHIPEENLTSACNVVVPEQMKTVIEEWKINISLLSRKMEMNESTLRNKIKGYNSTHFSLMEFLKFKSILKTMVEEVNSSLSFYPNFDE